MHTRGSRLTRRHAQHRKHTVDCVSARHGRTTGAVAECTRVSRTYTVHATLVLPNSPYAEPDPCEFTPVLKSVATAASKPRERQQRLRAGVATAVPTPPQPQTKAPAPQRLERTCAPERLAAPVITSSGHLCRRVSPRPVGCKLRRHCASVPIKQDLPRWCCLRCCPGQQQFQS
jgi:hypothetical protein